jgi:hypothetical protein
MADYLDMVDVIPPSSNNPVYKIAIGGLIAWGIFVLVNKAKKDSDTSSSATRKGRGALTASSIDNEIDVRNRSVNNNRKKVQSDVPIYSRHNYNRRRRPTQGCM